MKRSLTLPTLVAALLLAGCSGNTGPRTDPVLATNLRQAPTSVQIGPVTLHLSAYLWRDFMPGPQMSPMNGSALMGTFVLSTQDPAVFVPVTFDALWVVNGEEIWSAKLENNPLVDVVPGTILKVARDGPRWATGITVDVVARVGLTDGTKRLIRVSTVIQRTE